MTGRPIEVRAPAKINLSLHVLGRRSDGYHELRTIFQSIALHDTLVIRRRPGSFTVRCDDPACPSDAGNLVWRAAVAVWTAAHRRGAPRDVAMALKKRIPLGAGLGGGSSDAAAALRALASLWRLDPAALPSLARELGADVPYFLEGGTALGLERGDVVFPLADQPVEWVVVVVPPFEVATADAYAWWDALDGSHEAARPDGNDLQRAVASRHPEIAGYIRALQRSGAWHASMSGSGSAVFGLFSSSAAAARAARVLEEGRRGARAPRIVVTRTLNRPAYQRLAGIGAHRIHLPFAPRRLGHS
jgi:4-diphosphocytidyl-2-C-methyl-D-erythritol kinase